MRTPAGSLIKKRETFTLINWYAALSIYRVGYEERLYAQDKGRVSAA